MDYAWVKIKYGKKVGYVLSSELALRRETTKQYDFIVGIERSGFMPEVAVLSLMGGEVISEIRVPIETELFQFHIHDNKGLKEIKNVLYVDFVAEACAVDGGGAYIFYDGKNLFLAATVSSVSDSGLFYYGEDLIFPRDKNGREGVVLYEREHMEFIDEDTNWEQTKITRRELKWNGVTFEPSIADTSWKEE